MADIGVSITGVEDVLKRLQAISPARSADLSRKILGSAALVVMNAAKLKAPYVTGNLKRSIHVAEVTSERAVIGPSAVYGRRIEFGFRGTDRLGRTYNQSAHPYLRPAVEENREQIAAAVRTVLAQALR